MSVALGSGLYTQARKNNYIAIYIATGPATYYYYYYHNNTIQVI